jgi:hypothetical protein
MLKNAIAWLLLLVSTGVLADQILDVRGGFLYDSNLPKAQLPYDIKSDTALELGLAWGRFLPLADGLTLRATLDASGDVYSHYSGLNNATLGGSLSLRRKFGLGAFAPWIAASGSGARLQYNDSMRDGWRYDLGASTGKRLTPGWDIEAYYKYEHRTADDEFPVVPGISGDVFDLQGHQMGVRTDYALTERLTMSAGFDYRRGDVVSTTLRNFTIFVNSDAIALDPVFGPDAVAYRLPAQTRAFRLGFSYALGPANSLNAAVERWISRAAAGLDYYNTLVGASYVHAF